MRIRLPNIKLLQRGDTIVEVLIAIGIVSFVLAASYALANRNISSLQDTQEHGEALKLVQTQAEFLRSSGSGPTSGNACFGLDGSSTTNCTLSASGIYSAGGLYTIKVFSPGASTYCNATTYTISATWDSVRGTHNLVTFMF